MFDHIKQDINAAKAADPAATSTLAVVLTYPGLHATWLHRIAHRAWNAEFTFVARLIAYFSRLVTGIEIHPAAEIGKRFFIDHGMGTVIGETAVVGDEVVMYHGVTLGGKSSNPEKRHPTLEDGVTVGASATLIGAITIGEGATVGAGAVVVDDVPPDTTVAGVPAEPIDAGEFDAARPEEAVGADASNAVCD
jgi:serine O-acetyltransferase